jgi:hypothetical protein
MEDVKRVTQGALNVWYISLALLGHARDLGMAWGVDAGLSSRFEAGRLADGRAGGRDRLIVVIGIAVNPNVFWNFFAGFHSPVLRRRLVVVPVFRYAHPPVPLRFWQDAFLLAAVIALGGGVVLALGLRTK